MEFLHQESHAPSYIYCNFYTHKVVFRVGFSVAGLDRAKFGFYLFQSFFVYCCQSDIDFTKNYILKNFSSWSIIDEKFVAIGQGQNHF